MDTLIISGLKVNTKIGVYNWEQQINQLLVIDLTLVSNFSACNDDLEQTIDYSKLCELISSHLGSKSFRLIETVAQELADLIKDEFKPQELTVRVSKPGAIKNAQNVQVSVCR